MEEKTYKEIPSYRCLLKTRGFEVYAHQTMIVSDYCYLPWEWQKVNPTPEDDVHYDIFGKCRKEDLEFLESEPKTHSQRAREAIEESLKPLGSYCENMFSKHRENENVVKHVCKELGEILGLDSDHEVSVLYNKVEETVMGWAVIDKNPDGFPVTKVYSSIKELIKAENAPKTEIKEK